jgi:hypothetical protein
MNIEDRFNRCLCGAKQVHSPKTAQLPRCPKVDTSTMATWQNGKPTKPGSKLFFKQNQNIQHQISKHYIILRSLLISIQYYIVPYYPTQILMLCFGYALQTGSKQAQAA